MKFQPLIIGTREEITGLDTIIITNLKLISTFSLFNKNIPDYFLGKISTVNLHLKNQIK